MFTLNEYNEKKYDVENIISIPEYNLDVIEIKHKVTKAKVVLMACDDKNRVFNIAFRTPVWNSKGTPHILEHSVLCGSRKYNVKDPFVELAKSSMNTFLNAMTYPDKTCYPVASANLKDFHNLVDVYLDAVFYPNAIKDDKIFMQEGWHYEIDNVNDSLKVNGVVLNEMKGVYSNPSGVLESMILKSLYSGSNYAYDYGGNPSEIINLSFDEFKEFHRKYYSPSNAIIYFYGDLDFNYELEYLNKNYLENFTYIDVDARFLEASGLAKDSELIEYYNSDSDDVKDQAYLSYNFSIDSDKTALDRIVFTILDDILFSSDAAIIKNKLMSEGYGQAIYSIYETAIKKPFISIVAQNIDESKKDDFKKVLLKSIVEICEKGIDANRLRAGINSLNFSLEEAEFGKTPMGLNLTLNSLETYLYSDDAVSYIAYRESFKYLDSIDLNDKNNIFYKTLRKVFIDNDARSICVLLPKVSYSIEKEKELSKLLEERKNSLSEDELNLIIDKNKELKNYQSTKDSDEDLNSIPSLSVRDLEEYSGCIDYIEERINDIDTAVTFANDRNVVYIDVSFDISDLCSEEIYLLSVISLALLKIDLRNMTYEEFGNYVDMNTGGLNVKIGVFEKKANFTFSIKALYDKCDYAFDAIYKLIVDTVFEDTSRLMLLLNETKANASLSILSSGHIAAARRAESSISFLNGISDKVSLTGIAFYQFISSLINCYEDNSELFNETITLLFKKLLSKKKIFTASINKNYEDRLKKSFDAFISKLNDSGIKNEFSASDNDELVSNLSNIKKINPFESFEKNVKREAVVVPSDVNFVAVAGTFDKSKYSGSLGLLKTLFNYEYLWTNIRVLGGAYGCMSNFKRDGEYVFTSYRDPNLDNTNKTYFGIPDFLKSIDISDDRTEKFVIGTIGGFDNPLSIYDKYIANVGAYYNEIANEQFVKERCELINTKPSGIRKLSELFNSISDSEACAIIGENKMEEAKKSYDKVWKLMA